MCSEDHGHAGNENGSGRPVHVRAGRVRRGRTRVCQRKRANDHQCETSWAAVAEQMPEHATTPPRSMRIIHSRRGNEQDHGFAKLLKQ